MVRTLFLDLSPCSIWAVSVSPRPHCRSRCLSLGLGRNAMCITLIANARRRTANTPGYNHDASNVCLVAPLASPHSYGTTALHCLTDRYLDIAFPIRSGASRGGPYCEKEQSSLRYIAFPLWNSGRSLWYKSAYCLYQYGLLLMAYRTNDGREFSSVAKTTFDSILMNTTIQASFSTFSLPLKLEIQYS